MNSYYICLYRRCSFQSYKIITLLFYTLVSLSLQKITLVMGETCAVIDTLANVEAFLIFVLFCFYLSLKNLECKVLYLCWGDHLLSLKIHTDICSHFELGQCLLYFSFLPPPLPIPLPNLKRKCSSLLQRYRRSTNLKPFNPVHSSSNTRVYVK